MQKEGTLGSIKMSFKSDNDLPNTKYIYTLRKEPQQIESLCSLSSHYVCETLRLTF